MLLSGPGRRIQTNCCSMFGGNAVAGIYGLGLTARRQIRVGNGTRLNQSFGEAAVSGVTDKAGVPDGYRHPGWFIPPRSSGSLATHNELQGVGTFVGAGAEGKNAEATLAGTGDLAGIGALIISMTAAITGSGTISSAAAVAYLNLAATLAGSGSLIGAANALAHAAALMTGSGAVSNTLTAEGTMAASITSSGGVLDASNVGQLVWAKILEGDIEAGRILRIIAAAVAGLRSGEPGNQVYRNLADTQDQITGTVTPNGNRTNITYGE